MSNITSCGSGSFSTENTREDAIKQQSEILGQFHSPHSLTSTTTNNSNGSNTNSQPPLPVKKKRSLPGNPDPSAEVIALSPNTLMTTNRFICEICNKGFQRDQNLQLHRRGHNLPWKLKLRSSSEVRKRVYVCPEPSCVHHNPTRALGDLTGIKKHFGRKHGEKKWKCDKCSKKYAVRSDWNAHSKICGTREYKCHCGTIFSRRDSFTTHRAFCDALAEENNEANINEGQLSKMHGNSNLQVQLPIPNLVSSLPINTIITNPSNNHSDHKLHPLSLPLSHELIMPTIAKPFNNNINMAAAFTRSLSSSHNNNVNSCSLSSSLQLMTSPNMLEENNRLHLGAAGSSPHMSATALLQKAAQMGATVGNNNNTSMAPPSFEDSFLNMQYMHNGQQVDNIIMPHQYNNSNFNVNGIIGVNGTMNGVDMFNAILDQSKALPKMIEHNSTSSRSNNMNMNGGSSSSTSAINIGGTKGSSEDVMTLDLLGIGGGASAPPHGTNFCGGARKQAAETTGAQDDVWRNWSVKNSFSATGSI